MDFNAIIKRALALVTKPKDEWGVISGETTTIKDLYLKYAVVLYAVPSVGLMIGSILAGAPIGMALTWGIALYALTMGIMFLMGILVDTLSPQFGGTKDMVNSQKLVVYSLTPYAFLGALYVLPIGGGFGSGLFYLVLLGSLYSFYIMFMGAPTLKGLPGQDKTIPLVVIMAIIWLILIYIGYRISARIAMEVFLSSLRAQMGGF